MLLSTLIPVYLLTFKPLQELLLSGSSCGTSCYSLLEKGTNYNVLCSSSQAWKGKRWEKGTKGAFPHGGEEMGILNFQSLFASSSLCHSGEKFISMAFLFPRGGEVHGECKSSEMGPQSLDLSRD